METRRDLPRILNERGLLGRGCEVGVRGGVFSRYLLDEWKGAKLYLIDGWRHIEGLKDITNSDDSGHLFNLAQTVMRVQEHGERVCIIRELSVAAAGLFADGFFDFVYLDAGHDAASVKADLQAWFPKIRSGGLFCGDDYLQSTSVTDGLETVFEVKATVDSFFGARGLEVESSQAKPKYMPQWWVWKP